MKAFLLLLVGAACAGRAHVAQKSDATAVVSNRDGCPVRATALAAGGAHACALIADGTVRCWGANYRGQLADGTTTFRSAPVAVDGLSDAVGITAGNRHTCAVRRNRTVWCWGANDSGQLGKKGAAADLIAAAGFSKDFSFRPVAVAIPSRVTGIAAGETHSIALTDAGEVFFWGQTGFPVTSLPEIREPFKVSVPSARRIAAGGDLDCAFANGGAFCWGPDFHWLGQETKGTFAVAQLRGAGGLEPFNVARGLACGVDRSRDLHCWGERESLGTGERRSYSDPVGRDVTVGGLNEVVDFAGRWHNCVVTADGRVGCWGQNPFGELGDGTNVSQSRPVWVPGISDAVEVVTGESSTCVRTRDGRVFCWGENGYGQLGDATTEVRSVATEVRFCAKEAEQIFPGPPDGVPLVAALQRGQCFGSCPVYSVRVYEDGTVVYRGERYVRVRGGRKAKLSTVELDGLRSAFRRSNFLGFKYECRFEHTDDSTARVFFTDSGKARLIEHYHGCAGVPAELTALEDEIDRIAGTSRWVGGLDRSAGPVDVQAMEDPLRVPGVISEPEDPVEKRRREGH
jgi:alpha-tubulin suppressor-like RCC1 family protein